MPGYAVDFVSERAVTVPLWKSLQDADRAWTIRDLHLLTRAHPGSIWRCLTTWERHGLVIGEGAYPRAYTMSETGSLRRSPPMVVARDRLGVRKPTARQRCWSAMGVLKRFDLPTLEIAAEVSHAAAQSYVNCLVNAGYLRVAARGAARRGEHARYVLIRRTGPKAPAITHYLDAAGRRVREVIDRNDGSRRSGSPAESAREVNHVG